MNIVKQKLKSRYLQRENLCYLGISDLSRLENIHQGFIDMYKKLNVSEIKLETIAESMLPTKGSIQKVYLRFLNQN